MVPPRGRIHREGRQVEGWVLSNMSKSNFGETRKRDNEIELPESQT